MNGLLNHDKLVHVIFVFVVGTILTFMLQLNIISGSAIQYVTITVISCFELVLLFFVLHYVSVAWDKTTKIYRENPKLVQFSIALVLGATYVLVNYAHEKSMLLATRDLVMVALVIIVLPYINSKFESRGN